MRNFLLVLLVVIWLSSCAVVPPVYPVPEFIVKSHDDVMTENFPTKKSVFIKFGTPTKKETFENVENWYYKLSEVTNSTITGISSGVGSIYQDPLNILLKPEDRALITSSSQINSQKVKSSTVETYAQFWFVKDTVMKWETSGVNYSYSIPNPMYNKDTALINVTERDIAKEKNKNLAVLGFAGIVTWFVLVLNPL
jgi:outer membrane protein assembly factor BamE (lipoprotein component of BamABCDE complex)